MNIRLTPQLMVTPADIAGVLVFVVIALIFGGCVLFDRYDAWKRKRRRK